MFIYTIATTEIIIVMTVAAINTFKKNPSV